MDRAKSETLFRESDTRFKSGDFAGSLAGLDELDRAFPNTPRILHPRAVCLEKLGRTQEAIAICDRLIQANGHEPSRRLRERLLGEAPPMVGMNIDQLLDTTSFTLPTRPVPLQASTSRTWIYVAVAVIIAIGISWVTIARGASHEASSSSVEIPSKSVPADSNQADDSDGDTPQPAVLSPEQQERRVLLLTVIGEILRFSLNLALLYGFLHFFRALKWDSKVTNLLEVGGFALVGSVFSNFGLGLGLLGLFGTFWALWIWYDLSLLAVFGFGVLSFVYNLTVVPLGVFIVLAPFIPDLDKKIEVGDAVPSFSAERLEGESFEYTIGNPEDVVYVFDLWASWCPPCRESMPVVRDVVSSYPLGTVSLVMINAMESPAEIESFVQELELDRSGIVMDSDGLLGLMFGDGTIPVVIIIDRDGVARAKITGYNENLGVAIASQLDSLFAQTPAHN